MKFKIGNVVVPNMGISTHEKPDGFEYGMPCYVVTSISFNGEYVRFGGSKRGYEVDCFSLRRETLTPKVLLDEDLFVI